MPKTALIAWIAALGAGAPPRKRGIDGLIAAMVFSGLALAVPLFALQLAVLRWITHGRPLLREPYLTLAIDSSGLGIIVAAELIRRWSDAIETELQRYDRLPPGERLRRRLARVAGGLAALGVTAGLLWLALRKS